ncbi:YdeI/OmpD-associated family protein [Parapedobacter sp. ISTM3]|uniref:YdeI/OmpD-associated family protein n=1 Tax=Parapedobacter sp. ISTM3 TaxID=2800130 RepID=UPI0019047979|nr:YdeI/OmpD-associated family protein [Parapedobacter sp. ISTM3]MBK1441397.1 YdeI/OmpD-associated family protein [Parapedobacter sp. ISTM3]
METIYPKNKQEWRSWLESNHREKQSVWVVFYTKKSGKPTLSWSEAVDEALCFGWIDSTKKKVDTDCAIQFFSKRKPTSTWSKINKEKTVRLIESGLMTKAGFESIEIAKQNGSWGLLDSVEALKIPEDLESLFRQHKGSKRYFNSMSKTNKKAILHRIALAKRPETRRKRIAEAVELINREMKK